MMARASDNERASRWTLVTTSMGGEVLLVGRDTGIADEQSIHGLPLLVTMLTRHRLSSLDPDGPPDALKAHIPRSRASPSYDSSSARRARSMMRSTTGLLARA